MGVNLDTRERTAAREAADAAKKAKKMKSLTLYTLTELESILGVTHRTLLTYMKEGTIKGVKIGGKWRVSEENLKRYINGGA